MRLFRLALIFYSLVILLIASFISYKTYKAFQYQNPQQVSVIIKKGSSVKKVAAILQDKGVISNRIVFELYLRIRGEASKIQVGEYQFNEGQTLEDVIRQLITGEVVEYRVTIPEGYNLEKIRSLFSLRNIMLPEEFNRQVLRVELLHDSTGISNLEGYLFPDTYTYDSQVTPSKFIEMMVKNFYYHVGESRIQAAKEKGMSLHQVITLASVIEKETGLANERPLIAGVFFNRLKRGMPLQSDPTVIYGIPNFNGNLTRADLLKDSPYNTYTRNGLPAGPIACVGIEAIDAVLHPEMTEALYFVGKGNGSHYFSKTLDEHNRAVQYFQLHRGSAP
jgi:UPF0755 protein